MIVVWRFYNDSLLLQMYPVIAAKQSRASKTQNCLKWEIQFRIPGEIANQVEDIMSAATSSNK